MSQELFPCSTCHEVKPLRAFPNYRQQRVAQGILSQCKACKQAQSRTTRGPRDARYFACHKDAHKERMRLYNAATREQGRLRLRRWRAAHPEKDRGYARKYYQQDPAKQYRSHLRWVQTHREQLYHLQRARHVKKHANGPNDLTLAQWREIKTHYGHCCVYCGRKMHKLTQDHITPLSQGGSHTASNIVPACQSCNSRKKDGPVLKPVQPLLLTIASPRTSAKGA
jgi:5-methylcytosine-specific restriction endonuclease McrA